jgi:winged helix DNA-binding protein
MLERMAGLQAQYAPSMYIGLWTRLEGFERDDLTRALERRSVVQGTLMRSTIHLVSARDYWPFALAIRRGRRELWLRGRKGRASEAQVKAAAKKARPLLADGPVPRAELAAVAGDATMVNGVNVWRDLIRVPPSGTWEQRRADLFATAEDWIGKPEVSQREAMDHLVRSYLRGFGPAAPRELADWAGIPLKQVAPVLKRLRLRRFVDEEGGELVDLPRAPLPDPETEAPVRLLPVWDATLLVHARRTGVLPEEHRTRVFNTRTPQSVNTFLVGGSVAGTWKFDRDRVRLEAFGRLSKASRRALDDEAERLAAFHR